MVVAGELGEVVLWLAGRHDAATVELDGDPAAVDRVRAIARV